MRQTQEPVARTDSPEPVPTDSEASASPIDVAIGERVRLALWRARITQQQLADALGLDQGSVSRRVRGMTSWKVTDVAAAAEVLGVPAADLMPPLDEAPTTTERTPA